MYCASAARGQLPQNVVGEAPFFSRIASWCPVQRTAHEHSGQVGVYVSGSQPQRKQVGVVSGSPHLGQVTIGLRKR